MLLNCYDWDLEQVFLQQRQNQAFVLQMVVYQVTLATPHWISGFGRREEPEVRATIFSLYKLLFSRS